MEILGTIAILILGFLGIWQLIQNSDNEASRVKEKMSLLMKHSSKFRSIVEKENLPIWQAADDRFGHFGRRLRAIIRDIDSDSEEKNRIAKSLEYSRQREIDLKEYKQKRNYLAYQNLGLIEELKKIAQPIQKAELRKIMMQIDPTGNVDEKILELKEAGLISEDKEKYKLGIAAGTVYHPYELDKEGNPRIVSE